MPVRLLRPNSEKQRKTLKNSHRRPVHIQLGLGSGSEVLSHEPPGQDVAHPNVERLPPSPLPPAVWFAFDFFFGYREWIQ